MRSALILGIALALAGACAGGAATTPPPPVRQPDGDPMLTADGKHFAVSRFYKGECAPAGSRGGCYAITLEPDGQYRYMLLDAAVSGNYVIEGDQVKLTPHSDMPPATMTLSADRTRLDDFVYEPAAAD